MPDNNTRLKAIIHDAKLACRFKISQAAQRFGATHLTLQTIEQDVKKVFRRFDQPEAWAEPIPFDELLLLRQIIQLNKAPEENLDAFAESMDIFLQAFRELEVSRSKNLFAAGGVSTINLLLLNQIRLTRQAIEPKIAAFRESEPEPEQEEALDKARRRYRELFTLYRDALSSNKVSAKKTDVNLFKVYHGAFESIAELEDFNELLEEYNDTIEERCPEAAP